MPSIENAQVYWNPGPAPKPIRGLFDVAEVVNYTDPHMSLGVDHMTVRCSLGQSWVDYCMPQLGGDKVMSQFTPAFSVPFTVYDGVSCVVGFTYDEQASALQESFDVKAEAVAESMLLQLITDNTEYIPSDDSKQLVGKADTELAHKYAGRGLIHTTRMKATALFSENMFQTVESNTSHVQTISGTPVVIGRGYSNQYTNDLYAWTGRVVVLRGPVITAYATPTATNNNTPILLIEQPHVLLVECILGRGGIGG